MIEIFPYREYSAPCELLPEHHFVNRKCTYSIRRTEQQGQRMFTRAADPPRINSFGFGTTTYTGITLAGACCATSTVVFTLIEVLCQDPSFSTGQYHSS